ncbi:dUTP diphosphatase [Bacillus cereus group sp. BfR-BA-01033]|uniref:dUTP diphosphatase n=1 Tax=Bacillus TaxID=1386 RepID=UPI0029C10A5A|nr:dUTP diphosphatase [Bacillus cereus group sp. BfR-BA-01033]MDX5923255.1 dUTP diphosphatase [Bacillus cereus group sp. BfR-BA-01033]
MLNIQKIFEAQDKLDRKVVEVHGLEGQNLTGDVTQALYTELGELSNEIGFFKYWKKNKKNDKARQHDEWADCMHFMASLGNKYGHVEVVIQEVMQKAIASDINNVRLLSYHKLFEIVYAVDFSVPREYTIALTTVVVIGLKLGMTFEDMEKAYFDKNQVNYDRLASGY